MHLTLGEFCEVVKPLTRSNAEKAIAILWFNDLLHPDIAMTPGQLTKLMADHHVGTPHATQLGEAIRRTKLANASKGGYTLRPGSRSLIRQWLPTDLDGMQPAMDHASGYIGNAIWSGTNNYVEGVCRQLNGCYKACYFDAAAVMLRRLIETLIIEAYEAIGRRGDILDSAGNPQLLDQLINVATSHTPPAGMGLSIGREAKGGLSAIRKLGNRSAHNRRVLANRADLTDVRSGARTAIEELVSIAGLKRP